MCLIIFQKEDKDKKEKDRDKERGKHQFVSVSFSNSTKCDFCDKSMANKDALQCIGKIQILVQTSNLLKVRYRLGNSKILTGPNSNVKADGVTNLH